MLICKINSSSERLEVGRVSVALPMGWDWVDLKIWSESQHCLKRIRLIDNVVASDE